MGFMVDGDGVYYVMKRLRKGDYTVRPITVKKLWEFSTNTASINYYPHFNIQPLRSLYAENHKYFGNVANISSSLYERVFQSQSLDPKLLWYYLDHNYYSDHKTEKIPSQITGTDFSSYLAESGSLLIIPRSSVGEGILEKSLEITNYNYYTESLQYIMVDDGNGNVIDSSFDHTKFISNDTLLMYVGFNEKYREYNFVKKKLPYVQDYTSETSVLGVSNVRQINYVPGIPTTDTSQSSGTCAQFSGAHLKVHDVNKFNFLIREDFSFSFWINTPPSQSSEITTYNHLFNKNTKRLVDTQTINKLNGMQSVVTEEQVRPTQQFPFDILITNSTSDKSNVIKFSHSSNIQYSEVTSSQLSYGKWHHVVCQKSSSYLQIWVDGTLQSSVSSSVTLPVTNRHNFYIAGNGTNDSYFSGSLDEIRIYKKGLNSSEINNLYDNSLRNGYAYQTSRIGNIFYKQGIISVTDPRPKYANAFLGKNGNFDYEVTKHGFDGRFRSQTTFYEHEIICKLKKNEFNFTQNPTIKKDRDSDVSMVDDYVTSSFFNPYVTTIGLYNDHQELMAVAKLANAVPKKDDIDVNFIIRFDV